MNSLLQKDHQEYCNLKTGHFILKQHKSKIDPDTQIKTCLC